MLPLKLQKKLENRTAKNALRSLSLDNEGIDFSSNDYLGFSSNPVIAEQIQNRSQSILNEYDVVNNGATGSRLLTGNHKLYEVAEGVISTFHRSESALIFNSGYDANIGFFQSVPQRGDYILYDEYIHASIRDGIQMSLARGYKFKHGDLKHLELQLSARKETLAKDCVIYVVTESVFSMDGDSPDLKSIVTICSKYNALLVVDEAHAIGVLGVEGIGLVQDLKLEDKVFARIITFGKAIGGHGAAILGSAELRNYLINYARSFIYTTGLPPHSIALVIAAYQQLMNNKEQCSPIDKLQELILFFRDQLEVLNIDAHFIASTSAIHCALVKGNENVKKLSRKLKKENYNVKPILSPTVPEGQERLRVCLHGYNTKEQIVKLLHLLKEHF